MAIYGIMPYISTLQWFIPTLLFTILSSNYYKQPVSISRTELLNEYDFIIVGGGSAGAVLANRLSEVPYVSVLLLEAGKDETDLSDVPALAQYLQLSEMDWKYKTEPQDSACQGLVRQQCNWPRGKTLGGSSVLNYMLYVRGSRHDYNQWETLGNKGWSYEDVLPYFMKSEDNQDPDVYFNSYYHNRGGYLSVKRAPVSTPLARAFLDAAEELGYLVGDYNAGYQSRFMTPQATLRKGSRCSTSKAFLKPVQSRPNLHIATQAMVKKVLIRRKSRRAYGVLVDHNGKTLKIRTRCEVILSAGSLNSAQLLLLSGIGPADHLEFHKIPVIKELPVGHNLQDHISVGGLVFTIDQPISLVQSRLENIQTMVEYARSGTGPLTIPGGVEGLGFVNTKYVNATHDWPDIEFHFVSGGPASDGAKQLRLAHGLTDELYDTVYKPLEGKDTWSLFPMLLRPKSHGYVRLRSNSAYDKPVIIHNYLTEYIDTLTLVEGMKIGLKFANTSTMRALGSRFHAIPIPGCEHLTMLSDEYLECHARHYTATIYHPVGTAKMGPYWDKEAVVDNELRVYGITGLRVVDGSIMPRLVSGNTNAPIIMIAEKAADLIKMEWFAGGEPFKNER